MGLEPTTFSFHEKAQPREDQPNAGADLAALLEVLRSIDRQAVAQCGQRTNSLDLAQQLRLGIGLFAQLADSGFDRIDLLRQGLDRFQYRAAGGTCRWSVDLESRGLTVSPRTTRCSGSVTQGLTGPSMSWTHEVLDCVTHEAARSY